MRYHEIDEATPTHGQDGIVPNTLYHGTGLEQYLAIRSSNRFESDSYEQGNHGFSTTEDETVAIRFARMSSHGDRWAVVLTLDGTALASSYHVEAFNDDEYNSLGDNYEYEWVVTSPSNRIDNAKRFITEVRVIDMEGDPNYLQPWDEVVHGVEAEDAASPDDIPVDALVSLRKTKPRQAQAALLRLAQQLHPNEPTQKLRDAITALKSDALYKMLWLYMQRAK